ncbi:sensor histidine kinase [Shouchella miscanthi]|uniref:sensor histidine kinase n=1 Tax=Shouchella miscanthi TaxID=2598861 RepID=UPI0011A4BAA0|nr:sensor histidine kinase [Shouchella miscanthi]
MKAVRSVGMIVFFVPLLLVGLLFYYVEKNGLVKWEQLLIRNELTYNVPIFVWLILFFTVLALIVYSMLAVIWKKDVRALHATLVHVANGNTKESKQQLNQVSSDFNDAKMLIAELETRVRNQADRSQRVMEQWAENESKLRSELVFKERQRIARELHDSVSQQLYAASMLLSAAVNQKNVDVVALQTRCEQIEKVVNDAQNDMRALLLQLRPIQLENQSFKEGVEQLTADLAEKHQIDFSVRIRSLSLKPGVEDQLFRITQEAIANALRHAEANEISVFYERYDDFALLKITDDGKGFNQTSSPHGYGLHSMEERAEEIGGTLRMISVEGQGTSIEVKVPIIEGGETT